MTREERRPFNVLSLRHFRLKGDEGVEGEGKQRAHTSTDGYKQTSILSYTERAVEIQVGVE